MGAPIRSWLWRATVLVVLGGGLVGLFAAPTIPIVKVAAVVLVSSTAASAAYRWWPAFDPLFRIKWRLRARVGKRCAITFDDGPSSATGEVLDILAREAVPATFFVLGTHVERHPYIVRRMHFEGHAVAIHGMTHAKLGGAVDRVVEQQIAAAESTLRQIGVTPAPLYRTPHGCKSRGVFSVARRRGLELWAWSRGVWDTDRPHPEVLVHRATRFARSGMVLLLHDGRGDERDPDIRPMVLALPRIIGELKRRGFEFVRLADA